MREAFVDTMSALLEEDPRTALVLAEISAQPFAPQAHRHPDRVINVGIREQLMLGVGAGLALTGLRPYLHSYAPFLVERAYEQVKLDLDHQGAGAVLVSVGASYDAARAGRTHQSPGDVALIDTLSGDWTVHVPGHPAEVGPLLRGTAGHDRPVYMRLSTQSNAEPVYRYAPGAGAPTGAAGRLVPLRHGTGAVVVVVGPLVDAVLAATAGLDVTVAYTNTPRPLDAAALRQLTAATTDVVLVEPYRAGTSAHLVARALSGVPHRLLALGTDRRDLRRYGDPAHHAAWHGLDPAGLRASLTGFLDPPRRPEPAGAVTGRYSDPAR